MSDNKYSPAPNAPCPCKSDLPFNACCGEHKETIPREILIKQNVISDKKCDDMVRYLSKQTKTWVSVNQGAGDSRKEVVKLDKRVTQNVEQGKFRTILQNIVKNNFSSIISEHYNQSLLWYEGTNVLYYKEGGKYTMHADSDNYNSNLDIWIRSCDRDYSILIYLSDKFEGGGLFFNRFNFRYQPKKGDLVFFPSDNRYIHTAEPVLSGHRYAVVSWCAIKESKKFFDQPDHIIFV